MSFYEMFVAVCSAKGVAPSAVAAKAGFDKSIVSYWKKHPEADPKLETIKKIAAALNVPFDFFVDSSDTRVVAEGDANIVRDKFLETVTPHLKRACDMDRRIDAKRGYDPGAAVDLVPECRFFESMVLSAISSSVNKLSEDIKSILDAGEFGMDK